MQVGKLLRINVLNAVLHGGFELAVDFAEGRPAGGAFGRHAATGALWSSRCPRYVCAPARVKTFYMGRLFLVQLKVHLSEWKTNVNSRTVL